MHWKDHADELRQVSRLFGLIGYPLSHSFSKEYFSGKFEWEALGDCHYESFELARIQEFPELLQMLPNLWGLNVTIPYKEAVMEYLDELDDEARAVGAVNTLKIEKNRVLGFNTDVYGFRVSLERFFEENKVKKDQRPAALILGTGGAAKAARYVLDQLGIAFAAVSRDSEKGQLTYDDLTAYVLQNHRLIINTTPLGMAPNTDAAPDLPYDQLGSEHFLFDLIYNPEKTLFLKKGEERGCKIRNGLEMLHQQAERAWDIWNSSY